MQPRTAILLQTHFFGKSVQRLFRRLQETSPSEYSCFVLIHLPPGAPKPEGLADVPHHHCTTTQIRDPAYLGKALGGPEWNFWDGGHADLVWLDFWRTHPGFDRYWGLEYDVRFSGKWSRLFDAFADNDADLLTTSLRTEAAEPHWVYWPSLRPPASSVLPPPEDRIKGFMPIWRASRAGMEAMDRAFRAGWGGHLEVVWPTLIRQAGLRIEDLGGDGPFTAAQNRFRYYSNDSRTWDYSPGSFVFKPAKHFFGLRRNRLYHPVKPIAVTLREDRGRVEAKLRVISQRTQARLSLLRKARLPLVSKRRA